MFDDDQNDRPAIRRVVKSEEMEAKSRWYFPCERNQFVTTINLSHDVAFLDVCRIALGSRSRREIHSYRHLMDDPLHLRSL